MDKELANGSVCSKELARKHFGVVNYYCLDNDETNPSSSINFRLKHSRLDLFLGGTRIELVQKNSSDAQNLSTSVSLFEFSRTTKDFMVFDLKEDSAHSVSIENGVNTFGLKFDGSEELLVFHDALKKLSAQKSDANTSHNNSKEIPAKRKRTASKSEFDQRTEESSAQAYFQFYGFLSQQQNMLQDYSRTSTYQKAILENSIDFHNKIVMDVGAGSGILSFFAVQAGAKKVYAIEASSMAIHCSNLVKANHLDHKIKVLPKMVEEVDIPEQVDLIISEPMGYMLVNERMLESYVYARKFLKKGGIMFPTKAELRVALFNDEAIYLEQMAKCSFWYQDSFHGIDLTSLKDDATKEIFTQPVVDSWHPSILMSRAIKWTYNFEHDSVERLQNIEIPIDVVALRTAHIHGIASWFDVAFCGSERKVWLSTSPSEPLTHWYQVRCLLHRPLLVQKGQQVLGRLLMVANDKQSYDIELEIEVNGQKCSTSLDLKQPYFRYNGQAIQPPPGSDYGNPSELLDNQLVQNQPNGSNCSSLNSSMHANYSGSDSYQNQQQSCYPSYSITNGFYAPPPPVD